MPSFLRAIALLILVSAFQHPAGPFAQQTQHSVSEVVKATVDSVVLIVISDANGKTVSEGSGFIASADGKIVTNHHVIAGANSALVRLNSGAFFPVVGIVSDDPESDVAVIKVSGKDLPILMLADSNALSAGDHVVAIGSPLGLENSVSDGIVSGFREGAAGRKWIQTTAPASHGNSGGPLLTMDEKVAGVVTWKATEGENLNFAVPSNLIATHLATTAVRSFGSSVLANSTSADASPGSSATEDKVWTSMTTGHDYKLRIDGDYIYAQLTNLPPALQSTAAFSRAQLRKAGDKWSGTSVSYMPYRSGRTTKWCRIETPVEIEKVSESRIEGKASWWKSTNLKTCQPEHSEIRDFVWIPK